MLNPQIQQRGESIGWKIIQKYNLIVNISGLLILSAAELFNMQI